MALREPRDQVEDQVVGQRGVPPITESANEVGDGVALPLHQESKKRADLAMTRQEEAGSPGAEDELSGGRLDEPHRRGEDDLHVVRPADGAP